VVQEPHLAFANFRIWLTAWRGSAPLGLKLLEDLLHTPWSTAGKRWLEIRARTGFVRVGVVSFPSKRQAIFRRSGVRAGPRARPQLFVC
jgi:hypothetical protein